MKKDGKKRVWFLLIFCTAVFAAFLVRLYWMQFTMADHYAKKLEQASQTSYTVRIPAARGSIVDRSGTALVQDDTVYDLALCVPAPPDTEMAQTLQTLKELDLGGKDVETQLAAFCSAVSAGELPLAENLTQAQCQSLLAAGLPQSGAVRLTARGTRTAVDGTLAPQLLGGVGAMSAEQWAQKKAQGLAMDESIGQWGLEAAWEDALRGRAGSLKVTVDRSSGGRTETIQSTPQAGDTLHLYLDADLQRTLRSALQQQIETLQATKPEGKGKEARAGAAVVVDVQTGGVLAAVLDPALEPAHQLTELVVGQLQRVLLIIGKAVGVNLMDQAVVGLVGRGVQPVAGGQIVQHPQVGGVVKQRRVPPGGVADVIDERLVDGAPRAVHDLGGLDAVNADMVERLHA